MTAQHMTDEELRRKLFELGYEVPRVVVASWAGKMRSGIEGWVRFERKARLFRRYKFPQCLVYFDRVVMKYRHLQKNL